MSNVIKTYQYTEAAVIANRKTSRLKNKTGSKNNKKSISLYLQFLRRREGRKCNGLWQFARKNNNELYTLCLKKQFGTA